MKNIKAYQGYMSPPMKKFGWLKSFDLEPYKNNSEPLVMFGCYKPIDLNIAIKHNGPVIIIWMGTDTHKRNQDFVNLGKKNIVHTTWLVKAHKYLLRKGVNCLFTKVPVKEYPKPNPVTLGGKVYTYLNKGKPEYHGSKVVEELKHKYPLLVGDDSVSRNEWYNGGSDKFYSQTFIGLCLSEYAGGGMSIQEMAVRGIKVVTNVLDLPNCIPWKTTQDVEQAIEKESKRIGSINKVLVDNVYNNLADIKGCYDLEKVLI